MNEPIISPWFFYLVGMTLPLTTFTFVASILSSVIAFALFVDDRNYKPIAALTCLFIFIFIVTPSEGTCYKMMLAQNITRQTLITTGETLDKAIDKAVEKIIRIQKGSN